MRRHRAAPLAAHVAATLLLAGCGSCVRAASTAAAQRRTLRQIVPEPLPPPVIPVQPPVTESPVLPPPVPAPVEPAPLAPPVVEPVPPPVVPAPVPPEVVPPPAAVPVPPVAVPPAAPPVITLAPLPVPPPVLPPPEPVAPFAPAPIIVAAPPEPIVVAAPAPAPELALIDTVPAPAPTLEPEPVLFVEAPEPAALPPLEENDEDALLAPAPAEAAAVPDEAEPGLQPLNLPASAGGAGLPPPAPSRASPAPPMPARAPARRNLGTIAIAVLTISALAALSIAALLYAFCCHRRLFAAKPPPPPPPILVGDTDALEAVKPDVRASLPSPAPFQGPSKFATSPVPWPGDIQTPDSQQYHRRASPDFFEDARESVDSGGILPARYRHAAKAARGASLGGAAATPPERASSNNWRARGHDLQADPSFVTSTVFMQPSEPGVPAGLYAVGRAGPEEFQDLKAAAGRASEAENHLTTHAARHVTVVPVDTLVRTLSGSAGGSSQAVLSPIELLEKQLDWLDTERDGLMFNRYRCGALVTTAQHTMRKFPTRSVSGVLLARRNVCEISAATAGWRGARGGAVAGRASSRSRPTRPTAASATRSSSTAPAAPLRASATPSPTARSSPRCRRATQSWTK